ncbi:MAG: acyl carrier protein [Acidimicrobiia bacterium]
MTREQARELIFDVLAEIAPEVDRNDVDDSLDLSEQLDLDSMDYLTWMIGISENIGLDIPQREVSRFLTVDGAVGYLVDRLASR